MHDRHLPRLCRSCDVPMARQEDTCWNCGAPWQNVLANPGPLRLVHDRATERRVGTDHPAAPATVTADAGAVATAQAQDESDRWTDEGGRVAVEPSPRRRVPAVAAAVPDPR